MQIAADVLHANDVPFMTSMSNHMHYGIYNAIDNLKADDLESGLKKIRCYVIRGFNVVVVLVDIHFKCLKDRNMLGKPMNVVSRGRTRQANREIPSGNRETR